MLGQEKYDLVSKFLNIYIFASTAGQEFELCITLQRYSEPIPFLRKVFPKF